VAGVATPYPDVAGDFRRLKVLCGTRAAEDAPT
jgi:hypothetical protein